MLGSSPAAYSPWLAALLQRLREFGWIENRNMAIEYRWTEGNNERYPQIAAELVRLKVDVIVALGSPAIVAAKQATTVIPIVFPLASDPYVRTPSASSPGRECLWPRPRRPSEARP